MSYQGARLPLVSFPPAGAAVLELRGAGANELAHPLGLPHRMDAKYTCQLIEGFLP